MTGTTEPSRRVAAPASRPRSERDQRRGIAASDAMAADLACARIVASHQPRLLAELDRDEKLLARTGRRYLLHRTHLLG
jgi:hypothetical protein